MGGDWRGRLQILQRIHPLVQNTNDRNPIGGHAEIDHVLLNTAATIARSNVITGWSRFGLLCKLGKSSRQHVDVPMYRCTDVPAPRSIRELYIAKSLQDRTQLQA